MENYEPPREPPLPPPTSNSSPTGAPFGSCPSCGQPVAPGATHCPRCGARLSNSRDKPLSVLGIGCLGLIALGLGSFGTCSLLVSVPMMLAPQSPDAAVAIPFLLLGAGASYLAILSVRRIAEAIRARRIKP